MGGGHHHVHGNHNNIKESDDEMLGKIQLIETIKHYPNHWHMAFFDAKNGYQILGGAPAVAYGVIGAAFSLAYYRNQAVNLTYNYYDNNTRTAGRLAFGFALGVFAGYLQFGDRQRLHNAWVAERLRRRYPESMSLYAHDLWTLKGVKAPHEFYRWQ